MCHWLDSRCTTNSLLSLRIKENVNKFLDSIDANVDAISVDELDEFMKWLGLSEINEVPYVFYD